MNNSSSEVREGPSPQGLTKRLRAKGHGKQRLCGKRQTSTGNSPSLLMFLILRAYLSNATPKPRACSMLPNLISIHRCAPSALQFEVVRGYPRHFWVFTIVKETNVRVPNYRLEQDFDVAQKSCFNERPQDRVRRHGARSAAFHRVTGRWKTERGMIMNKNYNGVSKPLFCAAAIPEEKNEFLSKVKLLQEMMLTRNILKSPARLHAQFARPIFQCIPRKAGDKTGAPKTDNV